MNILESVCVACPYCGEQMELVCDCSIPAQQVIEDCAVCCQPVWIELVIDNQGMPVASVRREND